MLKIALSTISPILEALAVSGQPLIEKYGGLVIPITVQEEISKTSSGEPIMKAKTFPVACGVNFHACIVGKRYQELVPNSSYRSLAYWEQTSQAARNATEEAKYKRGSVSVYDVNARLMMWMNIPKMNLNGVGAAECSIADPVALAIQNHLDNPQGFALDPAFGNGATVQTFFRGMGMKDEKAVFGKWSYGDLTKFLLYPFDFFTLDYTFRVRVNPKCMTAITLGAVVDCAPTL